MEALQALAAAIPEPAKDLRLNLQSVLQQGPLSPAQRFGTAVAVAAAVRANELREALTADALREVGPEVIDDALAAASIMAMNNVYYRFRHLVGRPEYDRLAPRLRMQRLAKPATDRADFELFALAVSAVNGCGSCIGAHEHAVREGGLTEEHVHEAVRIASVVHGVAVALELGRRTATGA